MNTDDLCSIMTRCCVENCKFKADCLSVTTDGERISTHKFPTVEAERMHWVNIIHRLGGNKTNWTPVRTTRICSLHFEPQFFIQKNKRKYLTPNAVPTIFGDNTKQIMPIENKVEEPPANKTATSKKVTRTVVSADVSPEFTAAFHQPEYNLIQCPKCPNRMNFPSNMSGLIYCTSCQSGIIITLRQVVTSVVPVQPPPPPQPLVIMVNYNPIQSTNVTGTIQVPSVPVGKTVTTNMLPQNSNLSTDIVNLIQNLPIQNILNQVFNNINNQQKSCTSGPIARTTGVLYHQKTENKSSTPLTVKETQNIRVLSVQELSSKFIAKDMQNISTSTNVKTKIGLPNCGIVQDNLPNCGVVQDNMNQKVISPISKLNNSDSSISSKNKIIDESKIINPSQTTPNVEEITNPTQVCGKSTQNIEAVPKINISLQNCKATVSANVEKHTTVSNISSKINEASNQDAIHMKIQKNLTQKTSSKKIVENIERSKNVEKDTTFSNISSKVNEASNQDAIKIQKNLTQKTSNKEHVEKSKNDLSPNMGIEIDNDQSKSISQVQNVPVRDIIIRNTKQFEHENKTDKLTNANLGKVPNQNMDDVSKQVDLNCSIEGSSNNNGGNYMSNNDSESIQKKQPNAAERKRKLQEKEKFLWDNFKLESANSQTRMEFQKKRTKRQVKKRKM